MRRRAAKCSGSRRHRAKSLSLRLRIGVTRSGFTRLDIVANFWERFACFKRDDRTAIARRELWHTSCIDFGSEKGLPVSFSSRFFNEKAGSPTSRSGVRFALPLTRIPKAGRSCRVGGPAFAFFVGVSPRGALQQPPARQFWSRLDDRPLSALLLRFGGDSAGLQVMFAAVRVLPIATPA
jgi:hypothetical protein